MSTQQIPNVNEVMAKVRREQESRLQARLDRVENTYLAMGLLGGEGVHVKFPSKIDFEWDMYNDFPVEVAQLPAVRRALGRLKLLNKTPVKDGRCRQVWVVLSPVDPAFKHLKFKYKAKLPKGAKCRIVTKRYVNTSRALVCEA